MPQSLTPLLHASGDYFETPDGKPVYLAGSHTWNDNEDLTVGSGGSDSTVSVGTHALDFDAFASYQESIGTNFVRLWTDAVYAPQNRTTGQQPWSMSNGKYNLNAFDQSYFDRVLSRVQTAAAHGLYVSVMLFNGGAYNDSGNWAYNPFNAANNSNGINGDPNGTGRGSSSLDGSIAAIKSIQYAYIDKLCDTLAGQTNVLFEICNESADTSAQRAWQVDMMNHLRSYAASKGYPAWPIGITAPSPPAVSSQAVNSWLLSTTADWISPSGNAQDYQGSSPVAPSNKVVLVDSDHVFGQGGDDAWVWRQFIQGYGGVLYMDDLDGLGISGGGWENTGVSGTEASGRMGLAQTREASTLVDMTGMTARGGLSSTGSCLANPSTGNYIVYAPAGGAFTVDLSGASGKSLKGEWMNLADGSLSAVTAVSGTASSQVFSSPYGASASALVLTPQASSTPTSSPASTTTPTPTVTQGGSFGSGADTLTLTLAEDAWQGDAQASVAIDGTQLTATPLTVTAPHAAGASETFTFKGNFGSGSHSVAVSFLNDAWGGTPQTDRNLYVDGLTLDGQASPTLASGPAVLATTSTSTFSVAGGTNPSAAPTSSGQDSLILLMSEDAWQGDAQFTIQVDGKTIGGRQTVFASHSAGQVQAYVVQGNFGAGAHQVGVTFLNDAYGGSPSTDRNLYLNGVEFDGKSFLNGTVEQAWTGSTSAIQVNAAAAGYGAQPSFQSVQPAITIPLS